MTASQLQLPVLPVADEEWGRARLAEVRAQRQAERRAEVLRVALAVIATWDELGDGVTARGFAEGGRLLGLELSERDWDYALAGMRRRGELERELEWERDGTVRATWYAVRGTRATDEARRRVARAWADEPPVGAAWESGRTYQILHPRERYELHEHVRSLALACGADAEVILAVSVDLHLHAADAEALCRVAGALSRVAVGRP